MNKNDMFYIDAMVMMLFGATIVIANAFTSNQLEFMVLGFLLSAAGIFQVVFNYIEEKKENKKKRKTLNE